MGRFEDGVFFVRRVYVDVDAVEKKMLGRSNGVRSVTG